MSEPGDPIWGVLADRYRLKKLLGRGGMGSVYLAYELKHDRDVAIKVLLPELCNAVNAERFLRELKTAARLQHPHILPVYDSGAAAGTLYYVMPYVAGQTVRERLSREVQLPVEEAVRIACEVASALAYSHHQGIVHRDIKPENILISEGYAVVADFGIARALSEAGSSRLTCSGLVMGTAAYMSPELVGPEDRPDGRSDLYSLGCVLYEMLAGHPPFTGATAQAVLARHATEPVPRLRTVRSTVPVPVEQAVLKALQKVPADRFATGAEFIRALAPPNPSSWSDVPSETAATEQPRITFFSELKRRRVYHTAILYGSAAFAIVQGAPPTMDALGLPGWLARGIIIATLVGFPITLFLSWTYDLTLRGLQRTAVVSAPARGPPDRGSALLDRPPLRPWLQSRSRLTSVLGILFLANWIETFAETRLAPSLPFLAKFREHTAVSAHWFEGYRTFENHAVTNSFATIGYSGAYFFAFPLLVVFMALALAFRRDIKPYRVLTLSLMITYLVSLPFFLFFPVPERWSYAGADAVLLSDLWSPLLIELLRPISALDNCFPSSHVSITVVVMLLGLVFRVRLRWAAMWAGLTIITSTYVLGIHWLTDIAAGLALGCLSVSLALRLEPDPATRPGAMPPPVRAERSPPLPAGVGEAAMRENP